MRATTDAIRRRLAGDSGFTLIEVLVATMLMTIGVMAVVGTFDFTRKTTGSTEAHQVLAHVAQGEIESILAQPYAAIGTATAPAASGSGNPKDPLNYVTGGGARYQYDWMAPAATEPFVVGGQLQSSSTWNDGRLAGTVYRFVTWVNDPCPACASANDYKRVTVAVTITKGPPNVDPVVASTLARDPS